MKRLTAFLFVLLLSLCACAGVGSGTPASTYEEQYALGVQYLSEGNYQEAILAFTAAIEIDHKQAPAYVGRGDAYVASGETEENLTAALVDYEKAVELDETSAGAWLGLADVHIRRGDYDKAMELLREALEKTGNDQVIDDKLTEMEGGIFSDSTGEERMRQYFDSDGTLQFYTVNLGDQGDGTSRLNSYSPDGVLEEYELYYKSADGISFYSETFDSSGTSLGKSVRVEREDGTWIYSASLDEYGNETSRWEAVYDEDGVYLGWDSYTNGTLTGYVRFVGGSTIYYDKEGNITLYSK